MPTLNEIIHARVEAGSLDLLLAIADYFYCLGMGIIPPPDAARGRIDVLRTLEHIHRIECLAPRGWDAPPPATADELPGWLLSLAQQADQVAPRPPEKWLGKT